MLEVDGLRNAKLIGTVSDDPDNAGARIACFIAYAAGCSGRTILALRTIPGRPHITPRHDIHALAKERFAHAVAEQLNAPAAADAFDQLVVVAPPHTLSAIRQRLDATTDAKIIGTLQKDLLKIPDDEPLGHVQQWVRPTQRTTP